MILGHSFLLDLILWQRTPHVVIIIVVQVASTCEVGRTFVFMCAAILDNVSAASWSGKRNSAKRTPGKTKSGPSGWLSDQLPKNTDFPACRSMGINNAGAWKGYQHTYWNLPIVSLMSPDEYS